MQNELYYLSASDAIAKFKSHELSPVELMQAVINRAAEVEPKINAFSFQFFDYALEAAKKSEQRYMRGGRLRSLEGLPMAIKDESEIKGQPLTNGSLIWKNQIAQQTSFCNERLIRAGAIVHARTTTPEFSCVSFTHSKLWGVTRNPWNLYYTPGGSSGGSAAALAAGTTVLASGSDIGGSIRIPSSACGLVGFKPPYGRNPENYPFNLDFYNHAGPLARTVADCRVMQNVMAGPHAKDIASLRPKKTIPAKLDDIKGWKIAYSLDLGYFEIEQDVRENTLQAIQALREQGARCEEVKLSWTAECQQAAWNYLGHLFGVWIGQLTEDHADEMTNYARRFAERAQNISANDYLQSLETAGRMYEEFGPLLEKFNVFICPTLAKASVKADLDPINEKVTINGREVEPVLGWCVTYPFNTLSRCPVMSMPSGFAKTGVPTGVQIVGKTYDDVSVFRTAAALEKADLLQGQRPQFVDSRT